VISLCMKAQGTLESCSGHFSPLGQYTSEQTPCRLMLSREQGKQNLWCPLDGHCTKWVSSRRSWQSVHLSSALGTGSVTVEVAMPCSEAPPPLPPSPGWARTVSRRLTVIGPGWDCWVGGVRGAARG